MKLQNFFSQLPIRSKLLYGYISAFLLAIVLGNIMLYTVMRNTIENNIESELQVSTIGILNMVKTAVNTAVRSHLRGVSEVGLQIVQYHYGRYADGLVSEEQAKADAARDLLNLTIGETGYVYCLDSTGVLRVHPQPTLVGTDISDNEFVRIQKRRHTGYIEYDWANPGEEKTRAKALYMTYFGPWDWIISATYYRDEFKELFSVDDFRDRVLSITFGKTGYSYVIDSKGLLIIHPKLEGTNVFESRDTEDRMFIREICERKNGKIIYPWQNPGEPEPREKLVIFNYIPELDWIVASSSYLEEFYNPLKTIGYMSLISVLLMLFIVIPVTWRLSNSITAPLHTIMGWFAKGAEGDFSGRLDTGQGGEIGRLSEYYNTFMEHLDSSRRKLTESEENYRGLFENAAEGIFRVDSTGVVLSANPAMAAMLGYPNPELLMGESTGRSVRLPDNILALLVEKEDMRDLEFRFKRRDGEEVWLSINSRAVLDNNGALMYVEGFASDITSRKIVENEQRKTRAELEIRVDERTAELSNWVSELERSNHEGALLREMGEMLQICRQEDEAIPVVDRYLRQFFPEDEAFLYMQNEKDRSIFKAVVCTGDTDAEDCSTVGRGDCWALRQSKSYLLKGPDKGVPCAHMTASPNQIEGHGSLCIPLAAPEELIGLLYLKFAPLSNEQAGAGLVNPAAIWERRQRLTETIAEHLALALSNIRLRETLRLQAIQDPLTGLYNRRYLEESMVREVSRLKRRGHTLGVIMADLDHFKQVNDTYGHEAGDEVLRAFGDFLRHNTRGEDIACRYGGEEFAIILMNASMETARAKAEELRQGVRNIAVKHDGKDLRFTVSIGVAVFPDDGDTLESALQAADAALYRAKQGGRDRVSG